MGEIITGIPPTNSESGLDFPPFIIDVINASLSINETKTIRILGSFFHPNSIVELPSLDITLNSFTYISSEEIEASVTSSNVEDLFDVIVKNNTLTSGTSGANAIMVELVTWIDLTDAGPPLPNLRARDGVTVIRDEFGLYTSGVGNWGNWIKFEDFIWQRGTNQTFSFVFVKYGGSSIMFGIGSDNTNEGSSAQYFEAENVMYTYSDKIGPFYGGGTGNNWSQDFNTISIAYNTYYKVVFRDDGAAGENMEIHQVTQSDWDTNIATVATGVFTANGSQTNLMPFGTLGTDANYRIVAFKIEMS